MCDEWLRRRRRATSDGASAGAAVLAAVYVHAAASVTAELESSCESSLAFVRTASHAVELPRSVTAVQADASSATASSPVAVAAHVAGTSSLSSMHSASALFHVPSSPQYMKGIALGWR